MNRSIFAFLLLLVSFQAALADSALEPKRTFAVIVGVLEWEEPAITPFPTLNRQDLALKNALVERGVPEENIRLLLDKEATWEAIETNLRELGSQTTSEDTFIFYYAGHGIESPEGVRFVEYDADFRTGFLLDTIGEIIGENFQSKRLLFFADCCYSGALGDLAEKLSGDGFRAAAVTSAPNCTPSGPTWAYTMSLIDAIRGERWVDKNLDHRVSLAELGEEVQESMRYRAGQDSGAYLPADEKDFALSFITSIETRPRIPAPYSAYQYVRAKLEHGWRTGRIVGYEGEKFELQFQNYAQRPRAWISGGRLER